MGPFKKYVIFIMGFFIPFTCVTLCQFHFVTSPVLFSRNIKLWNKRIIQAISFNKMKNLKINFQNASIILMF